MVVEVISKGLDMRYRFFSALRSEMARKQHCGTEVNNTLDQDTLT